MSLTTADKWGIGIGGVVLAGVVYEVAVNLNRNPGAFTRDFSANNSKVISGYGYNAVVNLADGYDTQINGIHYFVWGTYHSGTPAFTPSGQVFVFPTATAAGYYTSISALKAKGITFG